MTASVDSSRDHLLGFQLKMKILFRQLVGYLVCGAVVTEACAPMSKSFRYHPGIPVGVQCTLMPGSAKDCSIRCAARSTCRFVYEEECSSSSNECEVNVPLCRYCDSVADVEFGDGNFFLHTREFASDAAIVLVRGGLIAGEPVMVDVQLVVDTVSLNFLDSTSVNIAFCLEFRLLGEEVAAYSNINYNKGPEDLTAPHFNFQINQMVSVFYVVTATEFIVYIDQVRFKTFTHVMNIADISQLRVYSDYGVATIKSYRR